MYKRQIDERLLGWAQNPHHKPLILRGARQVGKTTAVRNFARNFDTYIELNLDIDEEKRIFETKSSFDELIQAIFFLKQQPDKKDRKTLIFIDEIQNSPKAVKQLRYFYEKRPDLYVIAAGSLLETLIDKAISFPVGRVQYLYMYPFSFEEFLWTFDNPSYTEALHKIPFPEFAHETFIKLFSKYALVGGMPEIVSLYRNNNDLVQLNEVYHSLITAYLDDVEKYATTKKETAIIRFVIEKSFFEAGKRIKFTNFGHSTYRSQVIKEALNLLEKALILRLVYPTTKVIPPIEANFRKSPKLFLLDTGLVNYFAGYQKEIFVSNDITNVYDGLIAEHIVAQELQAYTTDHLHRQHFWTREKKQSTAEVDFVYPFEDLIIPIEVKAGKSGRLRSLHQFIDLAPHPFAVRIYSGKFSIEETQTLSGKPFYLLNLPFYLISRLDGYLRLMIDNTKPMQE